MKRLLFGCLLALFLCGCVAAIPTGTPAAPPSVSDTPVVLPTSALPPTDVQTSTPSPTLAPTATQPPPAPTLPPLTRSRYTLLAQFTAPARLDVTQVITYINTTAEALPELLFVVEANRQPDVFTLNHLEWGDGAPVERYRLEGARLRLPLKKPLAAGESRTLKISYTLDIPDTPGVLGRSERQVNLGDWYPYVPPYRSGVGWLAYEPARVGEHEVFDLADFEVTLQGVDSPPWVVAAPGIAESLDSGLRYRLESARNFAWSISTEYVVSQTTVGEVTIYNYAFPEHARWGKDALQVAAQALELYNEVFGVYPRTTLVTLEADFFDGMEYDGLYYLGREYYLQHTGGQDDYLTALTAHETAHQWWFARVSNDQAWEPWLDEALCTYSELLYYERYAPDLQNWWWQFRSDRFEPGGWVNSTIYDHRGFRGYVDAVYLRGAHFMADLRAVVGDEAFFAALREYSTTYTGQIATGEDFFAVLRTHTAVDFQAVVDLYFTAP
jgi:hypothetical protein